MLQRLITFIIISFSLSYSGYAIEAKTYFPEIAYDPSAPTVLSVLGYKSGSKITLPEDMWRYMEALENYAPDKIKIFDYGQSWEGRRLIYLAISNPKNIRNLKNIDADIARISDPRSTSDTEAKQLIETLPAPIWLAYSVHGNEISPTDAAMMTAYHLVASRNDPRVNEILNNTVSYLNPLQNPDGRARFIHRYRSSIGVQADPDRQSAEHNEPWPSGRTNHYLFDMNRDWISLTQPETRGHINALLNHKPIVFVDLHEMGGDSTYYFAPEAVPFNPHLTKDQRDNLFIFGRNNAKWFDKLGLSYFTREVFDAFYPGYGASWPAYYGAIAMTYEQASARGRNFLRHDGTVLTFKDSVKGHLTTSLATLEATANNRQALLSDYHQYQKTAIAEGKADKTGRAFILPRTNDPAATDKLAENLLNMGIEITQAKADFKVCKTSYAAGTYVIDSSQPQRRMIKTLLDPQVDMEAAFVKEQERRREKDYNHDIYDVTAWSLAKMYNVELDTCGTVPTVEMTEFPHELMRQPINIAENSVVYLVPWGDMAAGKMLTKALRAGLNVKSNDQAFTINGTDYPRGTLFLKKSDNPSDLEAQLIEMATETGAKLDGVSSTWVDKGRDLGSRHVQTMHPIKIAMAWDEPTNQLSAGNSRFVIEQQMGYPVTIIRSNDLSRADLSRYQVLILPQVSGSYDTKGGKAISDWVSRGGVLIAQGNAVNFLTHKDVGLLSTAREDLARENQTRENDKKPDIENGKTEGSIFTDYSELRKHIAPSSERPDNLPGALVYADVDPDHFLTAGVKETLNVLVRGSDIYTPVTLDKGRNIAWFKGADTLLSSGYLWEENRKQLAYKPFVMIEPKGRGYVIGFTQEPTVRAYMDGLNILYMNAIFRGASHARPAR